MVLSFSSPLSKSLYLFEVAKFIFAVLAAFIFAAGMALRRALCVVVDSFDAFYPCCGFSKNINPHNALAINPVEAVVFCFRSKTGLGGLISFWRIA